MIADELRSCQSFSGGWRTRVRLGLGSRSMGLRLCCPCSAVDYRRSMNIRGSGSAARSLSRSACALDAMTSSRAATTMLVSASRTSTALTSGSRKPAGRPCSSGMESTTASCPARLRHLNVAVCRSNLALDGISELTHVRRQAQSGAQLPQRRQDVRSCSRPTPGTSRSQRDLDLRDRPHRGRDYSNSSAPARGRRVKPRCFVVLLTSSHGAYFVGCQVVQPAVGPVGAVVDVGGHHLPGLVEGLELLAPDASFFEVAEPALD